MSRGALASTDANIFQARSDASILPSGVSRRDGRGPLTATDDHLPPSTVTWAGEPGGLVTSVVNDCTSAGSLINK